MLKGLRLIFLCIPFWGMAQVSDTTRRQLTADTVQPAAADTFVALDSLQADDTISTKAISRRFDPDRAALLSAVLPGLGQAYNRKYWKMPLVYGGAVTFYLIYEWNQDGYLEAQRRMNAFDQANGGAAGTNNPYLRARDAFRRQRDLTIILACAFYALNITDAYVDAHLKGFDLNEDLAMRIKPGFGLSAGGPTAGLALTLNFK